MRLKLIKEKKVHGTKGKKRRAKTEKRKKHITVQMKISTRQKTI